MKNQIEKGKQYYKSIQIPKELDEMVNKTINKSVEEQNKKHNLRKKITTIAATFALCGSFILSVNLNQSFAEGVSEIPVIGQLAKLVTFVDYEVETEALHGNVKIPSIEGVGSKEFEEKINKQINEKMNDYLEEAKIREEEYKKAYLETGGKIEEYNPIEVTIDYELKSASDKYLSFIVYGYDTLASAYAEFNYYNLDVENMQTLSLEDILGGNYIENCNKQVIEQIEEMKKNAENSFFEDDMGFTSIRPDMNFYINESDKVVLVFDKYEIAPGYMGSLEFVIE